MLAQAYSFLPFEEAFEKLNAQFTIPQVREILKISHRTEFSRLWYNSLNMYNESATMYYALRDQRKLDAAKVADARYILATADATMEALNFAPGNGWNPSHTIQRPTPEWDALWTNTVRTIHKAEGTIRMERERQRDQRVYLGWLTAPRQRLLYGEFITGAPYAHPLGI